MNEKGAMEERPARAFDRRLWISMLGAPALWLVFLQTAYALVHVACRTGQPIILHITAALFLGALLAIGVRCLGQWNQMGRGWPAESESAPPGRQRAMAMIGLLQCALFSLIIITSWAAIAILKPCEGFWP